MRVVLGLQYAELAKKLKGLKADISSDDNVVTASSDSRDANGEAQTKVVESVALRKNSDLR